MSSSSTLLHSVFLAVVTAVITSVSATEYKVGGPVVGWRIPAMNETKLYTVWASKRRFYVGDSLRFVYGYDSLMVAEKWAFFHCDPRNPVKFYNDGDNVIDLDKPGPMYFMSGDADRCKQGLKMELEVMNRPPPVIHNPPPAIPSPPEIPNPPGIPNSPEKSNPPEKSERVIRVLLFIFFIFVFYLFIFFMCLVLHHLYTMYMNH